MLLGLIYNFGRISFYLGFVSGIFGVFFGIIYGLIEATNELKSLRYHSAIIQYNPFYINYYNYLIEYVNYISYSMVYFSFVFFTIGLLLPSIVSILTILYLINKYNLHLKK